MDVLVEKGMIQNPGQILSSPLDGTQELALVLLLLGVSPLTGFYCQLAHCRKKIYIYKLFAGDFEQDKGFISGEQNRFCNSIASKMIVFIVLYLYS